MEDMRSTEESDVSKDVSDTKNEDDEVSDPILRYLDRITERNDRIRKKLKQECERVEARLDDMEIFANLMGGQVNARVAYMDIMEARVDAEEIRADALEAKLARLEEILERQAISDEEGT